MPAPPGRRACLRCSGATNTPVSQGDSSGSSDHVVLNQARAIKHLITYDGNECSRNLPMITYAFKPGSSILHCLARPAMPPLRVQPASECGYELAAISEELDGHKMTKSTLTRRRSATAGEGELNLQWKY